MGSGFGRSALMASVAIVWVATASPVSAQSKTFAVPAQSAASGIAELGRQADIQIVAAQRHTRNKRANAVRGAMTVDRALVILLDGTGLVARRTGAQTYSVVPASPAAQPREGNASPPVVTGAATELRDPAEIVVTAQKREERIGDVPIAITALSPKALDEQKVESGADLVRSVPNVNFSKGNFSGYDFTIRGIGTKAVSASSDPAVAVSFNNTPLIRNRLFEAEFFDLQRIEVLRGPQGTLYGRNATAGVINVIPALPSYNFEGEVKGETGSYKTRRLSGMLNVPLSDKLAVRVAGTMTKRDGFDYNSFTQQRVNGRDLWSTRASVQWEPSDRFKINAIWQHFEEDDNRSRTGKQLCTRDPGPETVGSVTLSPLFRSRLSQGCKPGSLYDDAAFGAPNGRSLAFISFVQQNMNVGFNSSRQVVPLINRDLDPFGQVVQSRNLREIETSYDPVFRANNDVFQLNAEVGIGEGLKLISQGAYANDRYYSSQDYNRFVSTPLFNDSLGRFTVSRLPHNVPGPTPNGIYTDPQLGASDRLASVDLSRSRNRQWTQELRLQSDFDSPLNFNFGANYLDFKSQDDYFVYNNLFSLIGEYFYNRDNTPPIRGLATRNCTGGEPFECIYIDPNPIGEGPEDGHNYFRSKNLVRTKSKAVFGELYWQATDDLKVTIGARYTHDKKTATPVPSQLLLGGADATGQSGPGSGGRISRGYPALPDIVQKWGAFTGRLIVDWKPDVSWSDNTLVYGSASRGYKGGGANPPRADIDPLVVQYQPLPETFKAEYVNAFEIGTKNSFANGKLTLNATAFLNLYQDYQVSQIVDRISLNENFDATTWGLELEAAWRPSRSFRLDANFGYLRTRIGKGAQSIDVMNRTQGNPDWILLRPNVQVPSNCVAPREFVERILTFAADDGTKGFMLAALCGGSVRNGSFDPAQPTENANLQYYRRLGFTYNPFTDGPNGGRGFFADLEGNELPNAPHWTFNVGAQHTFFMDDWLLTLRGDYYRQAKSYARVFNTEYDRLRSWDNANLAITLERPESGFAMQLYVKNLFNDTPITNTFTNSDDTGLSTNIFTLDPRIIGFNVSKKF